MKVDFYRHQLEPADAEAVAAVLATPFLTTGNVAKTVEGQLCAYFSLPHAVLVNSWTNGAIAVLLAMDIGPGDEVIVPAMTFIASANVVELVGAEVVFADVDPNTLLLTPELAAGHVTARTRAIIPVHLYGQMCDIPGLRAMLDAHPAASKHISLIEDGAHCFEGEREGMKPGAASEAAIFSFYATKNVTCGEGGAIVTRNTELYERILATRMHGMSAKAVDRFAGGRYNHWDMTRLGTKANLPDLLAALLPRQITTVNERLAQRHVLADRYRQAFAGGPLRLVTQLQSCKSAEHIFPIGVGNGMRNAAIEALNAAGISVTVNYRSVPDSSYYKRRYPEASATCRSAHDWGEETLTLPLFPGLRSEEQDYVIEMVRDQVYPLARST